MILTIIIVCNVQGFVFPADAGYALDTAQARFYLMETHYNHLVPESNAVDAGDQDDGGSRPQADNSGLKLYYTAHLRQFEAGVLSIGQLCV